jgi:hypothetical protein
MIPEIRLRLDEAAAEGASATMRLRTAAAEAEGRALDTSNNPPTVREAEETSLRALLLEILHQIHWTKQRKFYSRPLQKSVTRRVIWAGLFSFFLFVLPWFIIYFRIVLGYQDIPRGLFVGLPLYTALTAGLFGAYFSRLQFIQSYRAHLSIGGLKSANEMASIFLRGAVGMCGGLVVFFFLRSGLLSGNLFPKFPELGLFDVLVPIHGADPAPENAPVPLRQILPNPQLALLAIWCFIAGFSERLVPTIVSSTEKQLATAASGTTK